MLALIPLRGGSKGLKDKNIKPIADKPLCQWVIESALQVDFFDKVIVSTDSELIASVVYAWNADKVEVKMRPTELAQDDTPTEDVMKHVAESEEFKVMCLIQATCPLTLPYDFKAARAKFVSWGCDSMLTVEELNRFVWQGKEIVEPVNYFPARRPMRQQGISPVYIETGNFYFTKRWVLEYRHARVGGLTGRYVIGDRGIDIDTEEDLLNAEQILRRREDESSDSRLYRNKGISTI